MLAALAMDPPSPSGDWRAALDLAGGELRFGVKIQQAGNGWKAGLCNGSSCQQLSGVRPTRDSLVLEIADYAASITARPTWRLADGRVPQRRKPRASARSRSARAEAAGRRIRRRIVSWAAGMPPTWAISATSPRVFELRNGPAGLEGTIISNSGDYGHFAGQVKGDSFNLAHFDGSFVYMLTGKLQRDTLRGSVPRGTADPDAVGRGAEHRPPASYATDRSHPGRHDRAVPLRLPRPEREGR